MNLHSTDLQSAAITTRPSLLICVISMLTLYLHLEYAGVNSYLSKYGLMLKCLKNL